RWRWTAANGSIAGPQLQPRRSRAGTTGALTGAGRRGWRRQRRVGRGSGAPPPAPADVVGPPPGEEEHGPDREEHADVVHEERGAHLHFGLLYGQGAVGGRHPERERERPRAARLDGEAHRRAPRGQVQDALVPIWEHELVALEAHAYPERLPGPVEERHRDRALFGGQRDRAVDGRHAQATHELVDVGVD